MKDLINLSKQELYKKAKSLKDLLEKRKKRLTKALSDKPEQYSPFGLKSLEREGIPKVSTKMTRNELLATANYLQELEQTKTTTLRGAKETQQKQIRIMNNLPTEGKLNAKQRRTYNEAVQAVKDNPNIMSEFWTAFDHYQNDNKHRGLDSNQSLEEFRPVFDEVSQDGYRNMQNLLDKLSDYSTQQEIKRADREDLFDELFKENQDWFEERNKNRF